MALRAWGDWADAAAAWVLRQQFGLVASALVLLLFAGATVGSMETRAVFTAVATNTASFTAGTVTISSGVSHAFLTANALLPGEGTAAPLTIANTGSLAFRYAIGTRATDPDGKQLAQQLELTIKAQVADCTMTGIEQSGSLVYRGPVAAIADGETENSLVGNVTAGVPPGPDERHIASGANETLCFRVQLPEASDRRFSAASTTVAFVFVARQAAHMP